MNSPELQILSTYIRIERTDSTPIYLQIAQGIINAIHTKALSTGSKLPSSRMLSTALYVHRNTVVSAFDELSAQGWVDIIPKKGVFVSAKKLKNTPQTHIHNIENPINADFTIDRNIILELPNTTITSEYYFTDGTADNALLPLKEMNQTLSSISLKKTTTNTLNRDFFQENESLKNQLINYIHVTKSLTLSTHQILATNNNTTAINTIIQTLLKANDKVIIIEPGNYAVHMKLKHANIDILPVGVTEDGLDFNKLHSLFKTYTIRAIYLQTNHLYPTVKSIDEDTKQQLLLLANQYKCIIIEDDNSSDFVYAKNKLSTLKKMDTHGCVIYLNSFQDLLPTPYNIAYIIAPDNVISELIKVKNSLQSPSNYLIEKTIVEYIKEGLLLRQIHRNTKTYLKRRDYFQQLLTQNLEQTVDFETPKSGLAFWITFSSKLPLLSIAKYCQTLNLTIPNYLLYQNQYITGMRLGFGHMNEIEAEQAINILSKAIYQHIYK
ncbi:aminotransferase-like domain-containing protein [Sphingobacterium bovistauri]|uniref:PLP-dependent aminotransferase family protein n=1 Tax=Sphingobacterium bovistauri TaxID=2781959 RepID=A0ABS7Z853_9SPHI|nr:PLP-dependent aminotransferase family protein [Sphingobacterium bovistauri]MCA5006366.1 PLP-dependent aminotransferase family protein [Sphingobacterium bovistauri]